MTQKIEQWMRDAAKEIISGGEAAEEHEIGEMAAIIASHAPSDDNLGFVPWCKDHPDCCGKCWDYTRAKRNGWCCQGDGEGGHIPECQYSRPGYAEVKPPSEAAAQPTLDKLLKAQAATRGVCSKCGTPIRPEYFEPSYVEIEPNDH